MKISARERNKILKERGVTPEQMDKWFDELVAEGHVLARALNQPGMNRWQNNYCMLRQLSEEKVQAYRQRKLQKQQEEQVKAQAELIEKQKQEYYESHKEEIIANKVINKQQLSEKELETFRWEVGELIEEIEGDHHRWQRAMSVIKKVKDTYFRLDYMQGLTENCETEYPYQPYVVYPKEEVIKITKWLKLE